MSAYNFFSNNLIYVDGELCEITQSLANTRPTVQRIFEVPNHTVGIPNLLVFVNGSLKAKGKDYDDSNSHQVTFKNDISVGHDVICILIKGKNNDNDSSDKNIEWESF